MTRLARRPAPGRQGSAALAVAALVVGGVGLTACELGADSADSQAQDACRPVIEDAYPDHEIDELTSRDLRDQRVEVYADLTSDEGSLEVTCVAHKEDDEWVATPDDLSEG